MMSLTKTIFKICCLAFIHQVGPISAQDPYRFAPASNVAYETILQFYQYDKGVPFDVKTVEIKESPDYIREKIAFRGINGSCVVGYLAIPKHGSRPFPCVLQVHGLGVSKEDFWQEMYHHGEHVTESLLASGIAVFALDLPYHGDRAYEGDFVSPVEMLFKQGWGYRIRDMAIQSTMEFRRAIDYLETKDNIDQNNIGSIGYSFGSIISSILTGIDDRISVSVICSPAIVKPRPFWTGDISGFAPQTFLRAYNNRPILLLVPRNDEFNCTVNEAAQLFDLIEGENKNLIYYDSGHALPLEHASEAVDWFLKYLK